MEGVGEDTYYEVLGVPDTASAEEIQAAYRRISKQVHPDLGGSPALFRRLQDAFETLSDPERRAAYDSARRAQSTGNHQDSGWIRVDQPTTHGWTPPAPPQQAPPPTPDTRWAPPGGASRSPPALARHGPTEFFSRHPAGSVALVGVLIVVFGGALRAGGVEALGVLCALCGLLAMAGSRRATWRYGALRVGEAALDAMSGPQFERLLEALFREKGYQVRRVGGRGDFGADLLLDAGGARVVVQAKRWTGVVRHDAVQQAVAAVAHYGATSAMVITTSTFSAHARTLARSNRVVLWDRQMLAKELASTRSLPRPSPTHRFFSSLGWGLVVCLSVIWRIAAEAGKQPATRRRRSTRRRR